MIDLTRSSTDIGLFLHPAWGCRSAGGFLAQMGGNRERFADTLARVEKAFHVRRGRRTAAGSAAPHRRRRGRGRVPRREQRQRLLPDHHRPLGRCHHLDGRRSEGALAHRFRQWKRLLLLAISGRVAAVFSYVRRGISGTREIAVTLKAIAFDLWETLITNTLEQSREHKRLRLERMEGILAERGFGATALQIEAAYRRGWRRCQELYWDSDRDISCRTQI